MVHLYNFQYEKIEFHVYMNENDLCVYNTCLLYTSDAADDIGQV